MNILLVSKTKCDDSFGQDQFVINDLSFPYRLYRNCLGGSLTFIVREDIQSNQLTIEQKPVESFHVKLILRNNNLLVNCSCNPHKKCVGNHLDRISESLDLLSSDYEKIIFLRDFTVTDGEHHVKSFCTNFDLKSLIRQPTCYKYSSNPACIDLILTNIPRNFQSACVVETRLSLFD